MPVNFSARIQATLGKSRQVLNSSMISPFHNIILILSNICCIERRPPTVTSERIRALRAKLHATDSSEQVDFDSKPKTQSAVPVLSTSDGSSRAALIAIRERLAAAHESRVSATTSNCSPQPLEAKEIVAGSRSSALRSRLEAMKKRHPN